MKRAVAFVIVLAGLLVSGCGGFSGLSEMPLPGGPDVGEDPLTITIESADVLNLARQATVKVDDVSVGVVDTVERDGWHAKVTIRIRRDVELPANAVAAIRQTGLLGEKYVELSPPVDEKATGRLADGAVVTMDRTSRSFEVEEVLGALSLLLNGGGIDRIHTITSELNQAFEGREGEFRALLGELTHFTASLDKNRDAITAAIESLDRVSGKAAAGRRTIARALANLPGALRIMAKQRKDLVRMLTSTSQLSEVATTTIARSRDALLKNLRTLEPVLTQLAASGRSIPAALEYLLTFPFPTNGLQALKGDYFNFDLEVKLSELDLLKLVGTPRSGARSSGAQGGTGAPIEEEPRSPGDRAIDDQVRDLLDLMLGGGR